MRLEQVGLCNQFVTATWNNEVPLESTQYYLKHKYCLKLVTWFKYPWNYWEKGIPSTTPYNKPNTLCNICDNFIIIINMKLILRIYNVLHSAPAQGRLASPFFEQEQSVEQSAPISPFENWNSFTWQAARFRSSSIPFWFPETTILLVCTEKSRLLSPLASPFFEQEQSVEQSAPISPFEN